MSANVIIRKQKIKIRTTEERLAFQLRKQLNDSLQYDLISIMEKVFAQNTVSDTYINIDKLKIELGVISAQDFEQHFIKLVETKLINELRKLLHDNAEIIYPKTEEKQDFYNNAGEARSLQFISIQQQELNALMFFLENGIYPWWYKKEIQKAPQQILEDLQKDEIE